MAVSDEEFAQLRADIAQLTRAVSVIGDAHFRIDELVREMDKLKRNITPDHIAGIVDGCVSNYIDRLPKADNHTVVAATRDLLEALYTPAVRTSTVELPSGPVKMTTHETRIRRPPI